MLSRVCHPRPRQDQDNKCQDQDQDHVSQDQDQVPRPRERPRSQINVKTTGWNKKANNEKMSQYSFTFTGHVGLHFNYVVYSC